MLLLLPWRCDTNSSLYGGRLKVMRQTDNECSSCVEVPTTAAACEVVGGKEAGPAVNTSCISCRIFSLKYS